MRSLPKLRFVPLFLLVAVAPLCALSGCADDTSLNPQPLPPQEPDRQPTPGSSGTENPPVNGSSGAVSSSSGGGSSSSSSGAPAKDDSDGGDAGDAGTDGN